MGELQPPNYIEDAGQMEAVEIPIRACVLTLNLQILSNLGFSGVIGAITGITLKKVGQAVALVIGLTFCALQVSVMCITRATLLNKKAHHCTHLLLLCCISVLK